MKQNILRNTIIALVAVVIGAPLVFWGVMMLFYVLVGWHTGTWLPGQD